MKVVIFGCGGQDGHYLTDLLLREGHSVTGVVRRSSVDNAERLHSFSRNPDFNLVQGDVTDQLCVYRLLDKWNPDRIYNLAAMPHVGSSYEQPQVAFQVTGGGCLNILEAIRTLELDCRFLQAGTSEQWGNNYTLINGRKVQNEQTPFAPRSPYACAKQYAFDMVRTYRESYGLWAVSSLLMNHESPMRATDFVTRKITMHLAELYAFLCGSRKSYRKLKLGNIDTVRDFGHARDYTRGLYMIMEQPAPKTYVIGRGEGHSVREFLYACFDYIGIGANERHKYYDIDVDLYRPTDVPYLQADSSLAQSELGWKPEVDFYDLVKEMMDADISRTKTDNDCPISEIVTNSQRIFDFTGPASECGKQPAMLR